MKIEIFRNLKFWPKISQKYQMVVSLRNHDQSTSKRRLGFRDGIYLRDIWKQGNLTIINHKNALFTTLYHYPFHVHLATIVIIKINFWRHMISRVSSRDYVIIFWLNSKKIKCILQLSKYKQPSKSEFIITRPWIWTNKLRFDQNKFISSMIKCWKFSGSI